MKPHTPQQSREAQAWAEVGRTRLHPVAGGVLVLLFLFIIGSVPLHQFVAEWRTARQAGVPFEPVATMWWRTRAQWAAPLRAEGVHLRSLFSANRLLLATLHEQEDALEDTSVLGQQIRPPLQAFFARWLGVGNEQAYVGAAPWLFYRPGVDYVTGPGFLSTRQLAHRAAQGSEWQAAPQPDPVRAIRDFHEQLAARDILLIVVPTPVKPTVHPEMLSTRMSLEAPPIQNRSYPEFMAALKEANIAVFDPAPLLWERKVATGQPQYLAGDTHWTPDAMEAVAAALAPHIETHLDRRPSPAAARVPRSRRDVTAMGDVALMLDLPDRDTVFGPETVTIQPVQRDDQHDWRADSEAEVLILGDSFSNIYSLAAMGWGESAGWVEQLSWHLGRPLDRLVRNDSGAYATRDLLAQELARGRDRLQGKRVVVWQFAARELAVGDWRLIPLELREPAGDRTFWTPAPNQSEIVTGTLQSITAAPRPGTVPYRDHVVAAHLVDLPDQRQALVYLMGMEDNVWTPAARWRPGEQVTLRVQPWMDVADRYAGLNRSDPDDFELQLQEPVWGVPVH